MTDLITGLGGEFDFGEIQVPVLGAGFNPGLTVDLTTAFPNGLSFGDVVATSMSVYTSGYAVFRNADGALFTVAPFQTPYPTTLSSNDRSRAPSPGGTSQGSGRVWIDLDEDDATATVTWDDLSLLEECEYCSERSYYSHGRAAFQFQFIQEEGYNTSFEMRFEEIIDFDYDWWWPQGRGYGPSSFFTTKTLEEPVYFDPAGSNVGQSGLWRFTYDPDLPFEPPFTRPDVFEVIFGDSAVLDILANDRLGSEIASGTLQIVSEPSNGVLRLLPDDRLVYLQTASGASADTFEYSVLGANGLASSATRVRVERLHDALARSDHDDVIWAQGIEPVAVRIEDLLVNDRENGLMPDPGSFEVIRSLHGRAEVGGNYVIFEMGDGFRGVGAFEYRIIDQSGAEPQPVVVRVDIHIPSYFIGTDQPNIIFAGGGADTVWGQGGDDWLYGFEGNDDVRGHAGSDTIEGGEGEDRLIGGSGSDSLDGGSGNDWLFGDHDRSGIDGNDTLNGGDGDDVLLGHGGSDLLSGGDGSDRFRGHAGNDDLFGSSGNDFLYGGEGADDLSGGDGIDVLCGGAGIDILEGGEDSDRFVYMPGFGRDIITDFEVGVDRLRLNGFALGTTFDDIAPLIEQGERRAFIVFDQHDLIALVGVDPSTLTEHDFVFG